MASETKIAERGAPTMIPVYQPDLSGNEKRYVSECMDTTWISSLGAFIERFEADLAELTGAEEAVSVCNGTVALHLALHCLGAGPGDEVLVPTFTYIASVNTIAQTGATPVFVESRRDDWLIDLDDLRRKITPRTKGIMPVHLYGAACDMNAIVEIAREHDLFVVEDCAEALGTTIDGQHVGTFGDVGTFSFFGNKTITTGEGGAVIARDPKVAALLRQTKGQGQSLTKRYWHDIIGFNYRMTNIAAAIGVAQMERFDEIFRRKREIASLYREKLGNHDLVFQTRQEGVIASDWMVSLLLPDGIDRDLVMREMKDRGIDTRPVFYCAHEMPMYRIDGDFPVAADIARRGLSLPSYPKLTDDQVEMVCSQLIDIVF